jgi:predicted nuclease of predicted toxin-antitoxin system
MHALRRRGIDVLSSAEADLLGAPDTAYLASARSSGTVVVTHDPDFLELAARGSEHDGIAYCDQGSRSIGQIVAHLVLLHEILEPGEMMDRIEFM